MKLREGINLANTWPARSEASAPICPVCRYQERGELLLVENVKLCEELEVQKVNLRDINEFLTNELKARSLAGAALEQRIEDLEVEVEGLRESTAVSGACFVMRGQHHVRAANKPASSFVAVVTSGGLLVSA